MSLARRRGRNGEDGKRQQPRRLRCSWDMTRIELTGHDVVGIRAANAGPFTLTGTNSWVVGRDPAWLIDPGPVLDDHLQALSKEIEDRGGLGGIALTHDHPDHKEAVPAIRARFPGAPLLAARGEVDIVLVDESVFGPLVALQTPGHAVDHLAFIYGDVGLTGDAVLGEGSVFIYPDPGALAGYLAGLERLREYNLAVLGPGHGPPVRDVEGKLTEYINHRLDRERRLVDALDQGKRGVDELLDQVWDDAPVALRPAAAVTLAAHLDKLADEGRLPEGVERPPLQLFGASV
jgi:glyoxylase-like metal-dependent hydrolase (beta-lactamase superfamily II)